MLLGDFFRKYQEKIPNLDLKKDNYLTFSGLANASSKAWLVSQSLLPHHPKILWLCEDEEEALEIEKSLSLWYQGEIFNLDQQKTEAETINCVLKFRFSQQNLILIATRDLLNRSFPALCGLEKNALKLETKQKISLLKILNQLILLDYQNSDETILPPATYRRSGDILEIHPIGMDEIYRLTIAFDEVEEIYEYDSVKRLMTNKTNELTIFPANFPVEKRTFFHLISQDDQLLILDEIDDLSEKWDPEIDKLKRVIFTSFPQEKEDYQHLRYLAVLRFYTLPDLLTDLRNKIASDWRVVIYTKRFDELSAIFKEEELSYSLSADDEVRLKVVKASGNSYLPSSFQNPNLKIAFITDKEIFSLKKASRNQSLSKMNIDFITSLKPGDYIVHFDHGIGIFVGITQISLEGVVREYLEIHFADNDRLFVPVDQADKVSKYMVEEGIEIKLNKLGRGDWQKQVKKAKKETEAMAKELLQLYAKRAQANRPALSGFSQREMEFAQTFPYEETPGQITAIRDVLKDLESAKPMDRLVCGDVGFGKTEVAMRAAFKVVDNGKQVALVSPVTILAEQHYTSFKKRMDDFGIRIEMLSRFRSEAEQKEILKQLEAGKIDIIIGTHRLLQKDVKFFNLGLVVIDEEQRFGVKQKEVLKNMRAQVDILTMTATPIPRTLNLSLNKLREITMITT
ncbi:MAG TPA: CarD family transcriptional regulator, partial [Candidatus Gracilibacteria bacterium]|nr:CarD family transcriptional regulator [Candidatus Gracilibacteria bacterium]